MIRALGTDLPCYRLQDHFLAQCAKSDTPWCPKAACNIEADKEHRYVSNLVMLALDVGRRAHSVTAMAAQLHLPAPRWSQELILGVP